MIDQLITLSNLHFFLLNLQVLHQNILIHKEALNFIHVYMYNHPSVWYDFYTIIVDKI